MYNNILEFIKEIEANKINIPFNKTLLEQSSCLHLINSRETYNFALCSYYIPGGMQLSANNYYTPLITLDEEDLEYFKKKYLLKLEIEYQRELKELNKKYNKSDEIN